MNRLVAVIVLALVLMALVTGCGGMRRYDARLVAADSLMHDVPESALALIQAVNPASLTRECDRAYHDLLLTQARYRCYITATSDSDINRALDYYRRHDGEREKLTRAYIYKGAVMEELGHPDSAMLYYKHAEATAAPTDYFNLGYSKMRIAQLYQSYYTNDSVAFSKMKQATHHFSMIPDTFYLITTIGTQGLYLYESNKDSARIYLEKAIALADAIKSPKRFKYQSKLSGLYFYQGDYMKAKDLAMDIIKNGENACDEFQYYYYAARSFIKLSCLDSANYIKAIIPPPENAIDSMNHFKLLADLAHAEHRHGDYDAFLAQYKDINDKIYRKSLKSNIAQVELQWDADMMRAKYKKDIYGRVFLISTLVFLLLLVLSLLAIKIIRRKIRSYQNEILSARNELENTIKKENEALLSQQTKVKEQVAAIVRCRLSALNELYYDIRVKSTSNTPSHKHPLPLMSLIKDLNDKKQLMYISPSKSFWEKLKQSVEGEYPGITSFMEQNYPALTIKDYHLFWLLSAKVSPQIIKLCMNYSNTVTVSNNKRILIRELMGLDMKFEQFLQLYFDGNYEQLIAKKTPSS
ncbi:MAG: hypothetical protein IJM58_02815 [Muribaculaceae bacterium]|nr:hypothetical protein [Muribaculaceae bacterium]